MYTSSILKKSKVLRSQICKLNIIFNNLACRGVWGGQTLVWCIVRQACHRHRCSLLCVASIISSVEEEKRQYLNTCEQNHSSFTALVMSVDGIFAPQTNCFLKTLTEKLANGWDRPNSQVAGWNRARTAV